MTRRAPLDDDDAKALEEEIREHVGELKAFYIHLGLYMLINVFLIILNLITTPGAFWAIWPMLGWGFGLGAHAVSVFGLFGLGTSDWEERKVRELLLQRQHGLNAEQVRQLLRDELRTGTGRAADLPDTTRMLRRLENLEAIVTSKAWDELDERPDSAPPTLALDDDAPPVPDDEQAARAAHRTR